jgi:hypothetical protein
MAFKQYTECRQYEEFKDHWQGASQNPVVPLALNAFIEAIKHVPLAASMGALAGVIGGPLGSLIVALLAAIVAFSYGFVKGFCDQWLKWRLICVQRDQCAVGRVAWIEPPGGKFANDPIEWMFDNDLSFNLRLTPYNGKQSVGGQISTEFPPNAGADYGIGAVGADAPLFSGAKLLLKPKQSNGMDWDVSYKGYDGTDKPDNPGGRWTLHCEIEGNGMETLCSIAKALAWFAPLLSAVGALAGAVVGAVYAATKVYEAIHKACKKACKIPILCDIVCFVVAAVPAAVAGYVGAIVGAFVGAIPGLAPLLIGGLISIPLRENGSWDDVANDPESGTIEEEDCVFVFGDHVYDAGHSEGWVEIHPVKHLQKVCSREGFLRTLADDPNCCPAELTGVPQFRSAPFVAEVKTFWDTWCAAVSLGRSAATLTAQQQPENWWCLHPAVDGCRPADTPGAIR